MAGFRYRLVCGTVLFWYVVRYFLVWYSMVWYIRDADTDRKTNLPLPKLRDAVVWYIRDAA